MIIDEQHTSYLFLIQFNLVQYFTDSFNQSVNQLKFFYFYFFFVDKSSNMLSKHENK